ncbi:hypothetical protein ANCCAN_01813 [Ancylostoma caninum]|uniref:Uncharacterized protein n=1 Tax=Ancylostoma caninum TaxID=29170 RepID=A0A368H9W1_ANCCA|nr:hypothetical protein ANCCAN_01813 [Ancylostoma caninum]
MLYSSTHSALDFLDANGGMSCPLSAAPVSPSIAPQVGCAPTVCPPGTATYQCRCVIGARII